MRLRTRLSLVLAALLGVAAGAVGMSGVAHALNGVIIFNNGSGKCLTVQNGSTAEFTPIIQMPCDGRFGQHWGFAGAPGGIRLIENFDTNMCMKIVDFANFGAVVQDRCGSGDPGLYWALTDLGGVTVGRKLIFKSYTTSFCLDPWRTGTSTTESRCRFGNATRAQTTRSGGPSLAEPGVRSLPVAFRRKGTQWNGSVERV